MKLILTLVVISALGVIAIGCGDGIDNNRSEDWVWERIRQTDFTKIGDLDDRCREHEERIIKEIQPAQASKGSYKVRLEACVQSIGRGQYLQAVGSFRAEFLQLEFTTRDEYFQSIDDLIVKHLSLVGRDGDGNAVPRNLEAVLYQKE